MRLTTKDRCVLPARLDLAFHEGQAPIACARIYRRQGVSGSCLEQLFTALRRHLRANSANGRSGIVCRLSAGEMCLPIMRGRS
jgi:DNA-binding IscR family transcriptional regulator